MSMIQARGLNKTFIDARTGVEVVALDNLDLEISADEIVTILGPSGCGKSTLLNLIAGFETETSGELLIDGRPITKPGLDRGVVFQDHALFPWLTVEQNIGYGLREAGMSRERRREVVNGLIELIGLQGFARRYPHELSGGMRQRVGLARVLAIDPRILLMDEPFAALDAQTRSILQRELLGIWEEAQKPILFVTHNIEEAVLLGRRVVVMTARPGRVKEIIEVDLPLPRDVTSAEFNEYRRVATQSIEEEVGRALNQDAAEAPL